MVYTYNIQIFKSQIIYIIICSKFVQMNALKAAHIIMPLLMAFLYVYFIFFLNRILWLTIFLIIIFTFFFVLYALAVYGLFHKSPGYQSYQNTQKKIAVDQIGKYKQNSRRIYELGSLMRQDITYQRLKTLQMQYLLMYQQYSFCDICELIQSPRSFHCSQCNKCVLRRQKHSELIGMCIGERNMKIFMQYMFISMFLSLFMMVSLILITTLEHHRLQDFTDLELTLFAFIQMALGAAVLLFGKQFFISYFNAIDNITETQRKMGIITKKNNPFKEQHYYQGLFKTRLQYLKVNEIADPTHWLQLQEEQVQPN